jgi:hypothetical protein
MPAKMWTVVNQLGDLVGYVDGRGPAYARLFDEKGGAERYLRSMEPIDGFTHLVIPVLVTEEVGALQKAREEAGLSESQEPRAASRYVRDVV